MYNYFVGRITRFCEFRRSLKLKYNGKLLEQRFTQIICFGKFVN
jgi:hypothetical protein